MGAGFVVFRMLWGWCVHAARRSGRVRSVVRVMLCLLVFFIGVGGCWAGLGVDGLLDEEVVPVGVAEFGVVEVRVGGVVGVVA